MLLYGPQHYFLYPEVYPYQYPYLQYQYRPSFVTGYKPNNKDGDNNPHNHLYNSHHHTPNCNDLKPSPPYFHEYGGNFGITKPTVSTSTETSMTTIENTVTPDTSVE